MTKLPMRQLLNHKSSHRSGIFCLATLLLSSAACDPAAFLPKDDESTEADATTSAEDVPETAGTEPAHSDESPANEENSQKDQSGDQPAESDNHTGSQSPHDDPKDLPEDTLPDDETDTAEDPKGEVPQGECLDKVEACVKAATTPEELKVCEKLASRCSEKPQEAGFNCKTFGAVCESAADNDKVKAMCEGAVTACQQSSCDTRIVFCHANAKTPEEHIACRALPPGCDQAQVPPASCENWAATCGELSSSEAGIHACQALRFACIESECAGATRACLENALSEEDKQQCMPLAIACFGNTCRRDLKECLSQASELADVGACYQNTFACRENACANHVEACRQDESSAPQGLCQALGQLCQPPLGDGEKDPEGENGDKEDDTDEENEPSEGDEGGDDSPAGSGDDDDDGTGGLDQTVEQSDD